MDVSIIIVNYNTCKLTQACIDSVFEKTSGLEFEVVLVDNASIDGSKEVFEKDTRITYIYNEENIGFGRANNLGYKFSRGRYVFLLNSDTYLLNNAIYLLWENISFANKNSITTACIGCLLENREGEIIHSYAKFPSKRKTILDNTIYSVLGGLHLLKPKNEIGSSMLQQSEILHDVDYITGADLMICRDVIEEIGLFDPDFFMYCEESEMQNRYMKAGYRRVITIGPRIVHLIGKSNKSATPKFRTNYLRSLFLYHKKTSKKLSYIGFSLLFKLAYIPTYLMSFPCINGQTSEKLQHLKLVIKF